MVKGWPRQETLAKLKSSLQPDEYAEIEQALAKQWSDSKALGVISQVLVGKSGRNSLIVELVSTHAAKRIVFVWIRTSPDEVIYFVAATGETVAFVETRCLSQQKRGLMGFELWEQHSQGDVLLYPDMFVLEGISGYSTLPSQPNGAAFAQLCERASAVASASDKKISVLTLDLNRFNRNPEDALSMLNQLKQHRAEPMFLKHASNNIDEIVRHHSIHKEEMERIHALATHQDAAKSLKDKLHSDSPYFRNLQANIIGRSRDIQDQLGQKGSAARTRLDTAVARAQSLLEQCYLCDAPNKRINVGEPVANLLATIATHLISNPDDGERQADRFLSVVDRLIEEGRWTEFDEQDTDLMFIRASKSAAAGECRQFIDSGDRQVAANQAAVNFSYRDLLRLSPSSNSSCDETGWHPRPQPGESSEVIFSTVTQRSRLTMTSEVVATIELVSRRKTKSLLATSTNRFAGWGGWISFLNRLCERRGVPFELSDAVGVGAKDIGDNEQIRMTDTKAANATLIRSISVAEDDTLGTGFRKIAFAPPSVIALMLISTLNSTFILVAILRYDCVNRPVPFDEFWRKRCEPDWKLALRAFSYGVPLFMVVVALVAWVTFWDSESLYYAATVVTVIVLAVTMFWFGSTERKWTGFLMMSEARISTRGTSFRTIPNSVRTPPTPTLKEGEQNNGSAESPSQSDVESINSLNSSSLAVGQLTSSETKMK